MADTNKAKETASNIAQDSSEIFDTYKKGVLKVTEEVSKFQPQYCTNDFKPTTRIHANDKTIR